MPLRHKGSNESLGGGGRGVDFQARQRQYFKKVIQDKWECDQPGHGVCVPTDDKQHWTLSERHIEAWVARLVEGKGTTAEPPPGTFEDIGHGAVWNRRTGKMTVQAVPVSPARIRAGINGSTIRRGGHGGNSHGQGSSISSQTAVGPGSLLGKALGWIGQLGLDAVEQTAAVKQGREHIACFKTWRSKKSFQGSPEEISKVSKMLEDALWMATPCYTRSTNLLAYEIGKEAQNWLNSVPDLPQTVDNRLLLLRVNVCLIPLILVRISDNEPFAGDLAWDLIQNLTRTPLDLFDFHPQDTAAIAINIVAEELAYSKCARQQPWLGVHLLSIVETVLTIRPLGESELTAINELALRREAQSKIGGANDDRSWEIALFAHCSDQAPQFKEAVLRSTGLPHLIKSLEVNLAQSIPTENIRWEDVIVTLRSLSFLTQHDWVIDSDVINERALLAIMGIFRRDIPERRLPLQYWATDILRNIIARRPTLVPILIEARISTVLSRIIPSFSTPEKGNIPLPPSPIRSPRLAPLDSSHPRSPSDTWGSHDSESLFRVRSNSNSSLFRVQSNSSTSSTPHLITRAQGKRLDVYRRAARIRAEELNHYISQYRTVTPETLPRLNPAPAEGCIWELTL